MFQISEQKAKILSVIEFLKFLNELFDAILAVILSRKNLYQNAMFVWKSDCVHEIFLAIPYFR